MTTTTRPVYRLPEAEREALAARYAGQIVTVAYSGLRDPADADVVIGEALGVARPLTGTGTYTRQMVIRTPAGELVTLSLATIVSIANPDQRVADVAYGLVNGALPHGQSA